MGLVEGETLKWVWTPQSLSAQSWGGPMQNEKTPQGSLLEEERPGQGAGAGEGSWLLPSWGVRDGGSRWWRGRPLTLLVGSSTD